MLGGKRSTKADASGAFIAKVFARRKQHKFYKVRDNLQSLWESKKNLMRQ